MIREKSRGKLSKGILLQQGNARVHTCKIAMDAVERNRYELIPHPAYSPDLAPSDYFLFPNLKKDIRGRHFRSNDEVVAAVEEWVRDTDPAFFSSGLMPLEHQWSKCMDGRSTSRLTYTSTHITKTCLFKPTENFATKK